MAGISSPISAPAEKLRREKSPLSAFGWQPLLKSKAVISVSKAMATGNRHSISPTIFNDANDFNLLSAMSVPAAIPAMKLAVKIASH